MKPYICRFAALTMMGLAGGFAQADTLTWSPLFDQTSTTSYSLRGVATSPDGSVVYGSFLHTGAGKTIVEYNATTGAVLNSTQEPNQAKSLAVDSRGYVFDGSGNDTSNPPYIQAYSADLNSKYGLVDSSITNHRFGGLATAELGGHYYLYATLESSNYYIQRYNVDDINNITLDSSFGSGGTVMLNGTGDEYYLHGLTVAADGTIYVAATNTGDSPGPTNGNVYKVAANGSTIEASASVPGAFDLALFNDKVYVSQYGEYAASNVTALDASTLALDGTYLTGFTNTNTSSDSGYSGLDISPQGKIYLADQLYSSTSNSDRLLVSSVLPVPLPNAAYAGLGLMAGLGLLGAVKRRWRVTA